MEGLQKRNIKKVDISTIYKNNLQGNGRNISIHHFETQIFAP